MLASGIICATFCIVYTYCCHNIGVLQMVLCWSMHAPYSDFNSANKSSKSIIHCLIHCKKDVKGSSKVDQSARSEHG